MFFPSNEMQRFVSRSVSCFAACDLLTGKVSSCDLFGIDAYAEDDLGDAPS
jgi:hypothetical protein